MKRLDLDDLPPHAAQLLEALEPGEELLLVRGGLVVARLAAAASPPADAESAEPPDPARQAEIFEQFRSAIEEDF